jgi:hypothetical protein
LLRDDGKLQSQGGIMISERGPLNILVVDPTCVPVSDVCSLLIRTKTLSKIQKTLPISVDEIFECVDTFCTIFGPRPDDFMEIECTRTEQDVILETVGLSDWVFLSLIHLGRENISNTDTILDFYVNGLEQVMFDSLTNVFMGLDDYRESDIHRIVFDSFQFSYGDIDSDEAETLLQLLDIVNFDREKNDN